MAADAYATQPVFAKWMDIGDAIVQREHGFSPLSIIYDTHKAKHMPFDRLAQSHPSLFMVQFAAAKMLQDKGVRPDLFVGVSLGEFVAMSVAGMIPFEKALRFVAAQPDVFARTAPPGALIAVLAGADTVRDLVVPTEIAGTTGPAHCVMACPEPAVETVCDALKTANIAFQKLPVPFAFHSRWIDPAREAYLAAANDLRFESPFWPIWSCRNAAPVTGADPNHLWDIVRGSMNVKRTFDRIDARGGAHFIDLSPTGTLAAARQQQRAMPAPSQSKTRYQALFSPYGGDTQRLDSILQRPTGATAHRPRC